MVPDTNNGQVIGYGSCIAGACLRPHIVISALMALEAWLLGVGKLEVDLNAISTSLILRNNNVMITAVVASAAMAFPEKCVEVALTLLKQVSFLESDEQRFKQDLIPVSSTIGDAGLNVIQKLYQKARADSDKLSHRRRNFETSPVIFKWAPCERRFGRSLMPSRRCSRQRRNRLTPTGPGNSRYIGWI